MIIDHSIMTNRDLIKLLLMFPLDCPVEIDSDFNMGPPLPVSQISLVHPIREANEHERKYKELREWIYDPFKPSKVILQGTMFS
jgi:hypothetical protein